MHNVHIQMQYVEKMSYFPAVDMPCPLPICPLYKLCKYVCTSVTIVRPLLSSEQEIWPGLGEEALGATWGGTQILGKIMLQQLTQDMASLLQAPWKSALYSLRKLSLRKP